VPSENENSLEFQTLKQVAAHFGVTEQTISAWNKKKRLKRIDGVYTRVRAWKDKVEKYYLQTPRNGGDSTLGIDSGAKPNDDDDDDDEDDGGDEGVSKAFAKARLREKEAKAKLAELLLSQKRGEVLPIDDINNVFAAFADALKQGLMKLDASLPASMAGVSVLEAKERYRKSVNAELTQLSKGGWMGGKKSDAAAGWHRVSQMASDHLHTVRNRGNGQKNTA